ncbi:MAG: hypothetical protein IJ458_04565 [Clostridia bacterium]|nr:hypothetical protein [Clostridia bacterium]
MKNKVLKICSVAVLLLVTIFTMSACGKKDNDASNGVIATIEGFDIESIRVFHLTDDYYNLEVGVTNTNNETKSFDFANIVLKLDNVTITHDGDAQEYDANQYFKWSFQIDIGQGLNVGDTVEVYYGTQKLKDIKVVEF